MKRFLDLVAVGCFTALVEAGSFKWNANNDERRWSPAHTTLGVMPLLDSNPVPTSPPRVAEATQNINKRSATDNTCAYISGDPDYPLYCNIDSACVYNSVSSNIGCCPDTSSTCAIWTTCLDSTDASLYTTDNGYTLWCGESKYPYCRTHLYTDDAFTGYTLQGCAVAAGTDSVGYSATLSSSPFSSRESSFMASSTQGSAIAGTPKTSATVSRGSPAPIGAIVGGVVGGIAVIALFALGLVFLLRRRRRTPGPDSDQTAQQTSSSQPGGYPPQPAMQQQYPPPGFQQPPADPVTGLIAAAPVTYGPSSIQKPGPKYNVTHSVYETSMTGPPDSPPPQDQNQSPGSALPAYQVSNTSTSAAGPTRTTYGAAQHQSTGHGFARARQGPVVQHADRQHPGGDHYEMPTEPSDRELRELA